MAAARGLVPAGDDGVLGPERTFRVGLRIARQHSCDLVLD